MIKNDSVFSELEPWNTSQIHSLNITQASSAVLNKKNIHRSMPKPVVAAQKIQAHRNRTLKSPKSSN